MIDDMFTLRAVNSKLYVAACTDFTLSYEQFEALSHGTRTSMVLLLLYVYDCSVKATSPRLIVKMYVFPFIVLLQ